MIEENLIDQEEGLRDQTSGSLKDECQEAPQGSGSSTSPKEETTALRHVTSAMNCMKIEKPKLSRKWTIQAAIAVGKPIRYGKQRNNRGKKGDEPSTVTN